MTFYRPGGSTKAINRQYDCCYMDTAGLFTGWLPINKGDEIAVNITRAAIVLNTSPLPPATVTMSPIAPEATVLLEMRMFGTDQQTASPLSGLWPIDQWQNMVVATSRRAHRAGWIRLRILAINNGDGTGINAALQVSRQGESGAVV
jgi:hypothetical protein